MLVKGATGNSRNMSFHVTRGFITSNFPSFSALTWYNCWSSFSKMGRQPWPLAQQGWHTAKRYANVTDCFFATCSSGFNHDDVIKWKHFLRYWPLFGEFIGHRSILLKKASDAELWFFYLRLNKRLSKQSRRWWFETPSRSLWRHYDDMFYSYHNITSWAAVHAAVPSSIPQGSLAINAIPVIADNPATHDTL